VPPGASPGRQSEKSAQRNARLTPFFSPGLPFVLRGSAVQFAVLKSAKKILVFSRKTVYSFFTPFFTNNKQTKTKGVRKWKMTDL
jgi:hypothetical protein